MVPRRASFSFFPESTRCTMNWSVHQYQNPIMAEPISAPNQGNREFTEKVLKYGYQNSLTDKTSGQINGLGRSITIPRLPNENSYAVTAPDCIVPVAPAFPVFTYARGNQPAGIAYKGADYRTFVLGFPFESIQSETDRASIMAGILGFFTQK